MHRFVSGLIASLLMLHVIAGCCWHHAHDDASHHGLSVASDHSAEPNSHCSHAEHSHSTTPGTPAEGDHHEHPCDEPECVFNGVPSQRQFDDGVERGDVCLILALPCDVALCTITRAYPSDAVDDVAIDLPVRRHLLYSTLLI